MVQSWQYEEPKYWDTYVPQPEDYATTAEWEDALRAGSEDNSEVIGRYWDPIGQVWRGGKTTTQEQALVKFGNRGDSYNAGLGGASLRLDSSIGVNPDEARAAYMAYDEFGNSRIDPAVLALIEQRLGIGANEPPPVESPASQLPTSEERGFSQWTLSDDGTRAMNVAGWTAQQGPDGTWTFIPPQYGDPWSNSGPMTQEQYQHYVIGMQQPAAGPGAPPVDAGGGPPVGGPPAAPPAAVPPGGGDGTGRPPLAPPPDPVGDPGNYPGSGSESGGPDGDPRLANLPPVEPIGGNGNLPGAGNATIDPRYPDWLLQATMPQRRNQRWRPRPIAADGLGGY